LGTSKDSNLQNGLAPLSKPKASVWEARASGTAKLCHER